MITLCNSVYLKVLIDNLCCLIETHNLRENDHEITYT